MCDCVQILPTSTYPWLGNFLFLFETGQYQYDRVPYSSNCSSDSKLRDYHRIRLQEFQLSLLSAEAVEESIPWCPVPVAAAVCLYVQGKGTMAHVYDTDMKEEGGGSFGALELWSFWTLELWSSGALELSA